MFVALGEGTYLFEFICTGAAKKKSLCERKRRTMGENEHSMTHTMVPSSPKGLWAMALSSG
jgi:hypothetical protein